MPAPAVPSPALTDREAVLLAAAAKLAGRGCVVSARNLSDLARMSAAWASEVRAGLVARGLWPHPVPVPRDVRDNRVRPGPDEDAEVPDAGEIAVRAAAIRARWGPARWAEQPGAIRVFRVAVGRRPGGPQP